MGSEGVRPNALGSGAHDDMFSLIKAEIQDLLEDAEREIFRK